jgi:hypothetical protein
VVAHGVETDHQTVGDGLVRQSFRKELEHLDLARGEVATGGSHLRAELGQESREHVG